MTSEELRIFFAKNKLPFFTKTFWPYNQEPINFVFLANSDKVQTAFKKTGWYLADPLNPFTFSKMPIAYFSSRNYHNGPVTPYVYNGKVHSFAFQKPTEINHIRQRHHLRFWNLNIKFQKQNVVLATASYDRDIKWFFTHKMDADLDFEREFIFKDLKKENQIKNYQKIQLVTSIKGRNVYFDPFYTDGKAYVLWL